MSEIQWMLGAPVIVKPHWGKARPGKVSKVTRTSITVTYDDGTTDRFTRRGTLWGGPYTFPTRARQCTVEEADNLRYKLAAQRGGEGE